MCWFGAPWSCFRWACDQVHQHSCDDCDHQRLLCVYWHLPQLPSGSVGLSHARKIKPSALLTCSVTWKGLWALQPRCSSLFSPNHLLVSWNEPSVGLFICFLCCKQFLTPQVIRRQLWLCDHTHVSGLLKSEALKCGNVQWRTALCACHGQKYIEK